jgi:hypothetical protein
VLDTDGEANGQQELLGEELGGRRDARVHVHHLLGQDRHTDAEPHDRRAYVARQSDRRVRHLGRPIGRRLQQGQCHVNGPTSCSRAVQLCRVPTRTGIVNIFYWAEKWEGHTVTYQTKKKENHELNPATIVWVYDFSLPDRLRCHLLVSLYPR